jgi:hypothetical protein
VVESKNTTALSLEKPRAVSVLSEGLQSALRSSQNSARPVGLPVLAPILRAPAYVPSTTPPLHMKLSFLSVRGVLFLRLAVALGKGWRTRLCGAFMISWRTRARYASFLIRDFFPEKFFCRGTAAVISPSKKASPISRRSWQC